jgi:hypothetical protein
MRNGDFSSLLSAGVVLADATTRTGTFPNITQSVFPNNQIPQTRLSPGSTLLLKYMPEPNQPAAPGLPFRNYQYALVTVDKDTVTSASISESSRSQWFDATVGTTNPNLPPTR